MAAPRFDNRFIARLPGDRLHDNRPRQVPGAAYSRVDPTPVAAPRTLAVAGSLAGTLGLSPERLGDQGFAEVFSGNRLLPGMAPWASNYGGHQFGHWAGQLGDGRAISLGEWVTADGSRHELQLKGAGPTPYSRGADGRAVLRSSLREFVCSEAMHHLGVPTTRALSLVATGEQVERDMFYDGHPRLEPGAVVCRVAPSFIRFGHFELPAARGDTGLLEALLRLCVERDFPGHRADTVDGRAAWFTEVCERTAELVAHWMRVGFVHGVLNTDNMSILGLTIDYGPYGWVDEFDPDFTPNTTDSAHRRYRFGAQPEIGWWNLGRLAAALSPLFDGPEPLQAGLDAYARRFEAAQARMMAAKLGLEEAGEGDLSQLRRFFGLLQRARLDHTLAFRALARMPDDGFDVAVFEPAAYEPAALAGAVDELGAWCRWLQRRWREEGTGEAGRRVRMRGASPAIVFRNYLAQQAIDALEREGDAGPLQALMQALAEPYAESAEEGPFAARRPEWARNRPGCSMLSCSS